MTISAPRWDLSNIYPSLESKEYKAALDDYKKQIAALEKFFDQKVSKAGAKTPLKDLGALIGKTVDRMNSIQTSPLRSILIFTASSPLTREMRLP